MDRLLPAILCLFACMAGWFAADQAADAARPTAETEQRRLDPDPQHRHAEIERLTADITRRRAELHERPRRKFISASETQPEYRAYLDRWSRTIERVGNAHFPEEARRRKLAGQVILSVAIGRDGQLVDVHVVRSSESAILDRAAVDICHLADPFEPIPLIDDIDILQITHTWTFQ